jgi:hypothetical protein
MSNSFSFTSHTKPDRYRVYLKADGEMDSVAFADGYIETMKTLDAPWQYDRHIDLLSCQGQVEFDDFVRLWKFWAPLVHRASDQLRTAVVTQDQRTLGRLTAVAMLFQGHVIRTFPTEREAEDWLDLKPQATDRSAVAIPS